MQAMTEMINPGLKYTLHIDANNGNTEMNYILCSSNRIYVNWIMKGCLSTFINTGKYYTIQ